MNIDIQPGTLELIPDIHELYLKAVETPDGLIRVKEEVTREYISGFLSKALENGLTLVAWCEGKVVGEIHAYTPGLYALQHLLTDLAIAVDPEYHGIGIGRKLFDRFLETVKQDFPHILRVELYVREHNLKNVRFYESLGFVNEGRQHNKIFKAPGVFETPQHMVWFNPAYRT